MSAFVLGLFVLLDLLCLFRDPIARLGKLIQGMNQTEMQEALAKWWKSASDQQKADGYAFGCFFVIALVIGFIVEPYYTLSALSGEVGNKYIAYISLAVIVLGWIILLRGDKKTAPSKVKIVTKEGVVEGELVQALPAKAGNSVWLAIRRVVFAIPTFYLVYLFLVIIKVVQ